jgi:hypothetical protein
MTCTTTAKTSIRMLPPKRNKEDVAKRSAGKRASRAIHAEAARLLAPFLRIAALVDPSEPSRAPWDADAALVERVLEAAEGAKLGVGSVTALFFPFGVMLDRERDARSFYAFYWSVRVSLEWLVDAWSDRENWCDLKGRGADSNAIPVFFPTQTWLSISRTRGVSVSDHPLTDMFKNALERVDPSRLRRCPVCRRLYYAIRKNTGACGDHLVLARVRKSRAKQAEYSANKRSRRRLKLPAKKGRERARLVALHKSLRTEDHE